MNRIKIIAVCFWVSHLSALRAQDAPLSVIEQSYSHERIADKLRDIVDQSDKAAYYNDEFFNGELRKILQKKDYTAVEKVQLFYLMLQQIGYAFVGADYLPPKQNYFTHHRGKVQVFEKTSKSLTGLTFPVSEIIGVLEKHAGKDVVLCSNALLLATLMNRDSALPYIEKCSRVEYLSESKHPDILNHYVCLSASLVQEKKTAELLAKNLMDFRKEEMIEDVICALYSKNNPLSLIKDYIISETDPQNDLAIQTALNALAYKIPENTFKKNLSDMITLAKEEWKKELLQKILDRQIPYDYSMSSDDELETKAWDGFTAKDYNNGTLISSGSLLEFDPH